MTSPKNESRKRDKRTEIIAVRLFPGERGVWEKAAETEHKDLADFIRTKVNDYIFRKETEKVHVDMGPILQELKDLQDLITKRDDLFEINRQMLVENAAALNISDATLEEKIMVHLGDRMLYTTQLVEFLQEDPEIVIPILAKMEHTGRIAQNKQRRWYKHDRNPPPT